MIHPSNAELWTFFFLKPGQKPKSFLDAKLTEKRRKEIGEHVSSCLPCRSLRKKRRIEDSRNMLRIFAALAIRDELLGGETGEEPKGKRKRKLEENLARV